MASNQSAYVLVVEDEVLIAMLHHDTLAAAGYTVEVAGNGRDALAAARRRAPDAVVLDINTPGQPHGAALLARLRARAAGLPAVVVTGYHLAEGERRRLDRAGGGPPIAYLQKPCSPEDILAEVTAQLQRRPRTGGEQ